MSKIIAIASQKGGTGKSTTAINLSAYLAVKDRKTLLIDMDPQSNTSVAFFGVEVFMWEKSIYNVLINDVSIEDIIRATELDNLKIVPSNLNLAAAEMELTVAPMGELRLSRKLNSVGDYDYVIIDCPPSLGVLTWNVLAASTDVFVPIQASFFPLLGIQQLKKTVDDVRRIANPMLVISGVILTMYDKRNNLCKEAAKQVREAFGSIMFKTLIRRNVRLEEAPAHQKTIFKYAPDSAGAEDYRSFAEEVLALE